MCEMDVKYIHNFLRVVQTGSMSEAARQLDLSPSAIAQQMRVLEAALGAPLLVRHGRSVRATAAGERLFERGQRLMQDFDGLREWVLGDADGGELRLGTVNTALHGFLPAVLQAFVARHEQVRISVRAGLTPELYTALVQSELDVLICLRPSFDLPKTVCWAELREDPLALLRSRPLVRYDRTLAGGRLADRYLKAQGIVPVERMELNSVLAVAMMVDQGLGVGLVPDIGNVLAQGREVRALALPGAGNGSGGTGVGASAPDARKVGLLWLNTSARARWARSLLDCARQCLG